MPHRRTGSARLRPAFGGSGQVLVTSGRGPVARRVLVLGGVASPVERAHGHQPAASGSATGAGTGSASVAGLALGDSALGTSGLAPSGLTASALAASV